VTRLRGLSDTVKVIVHRGACLGNRFSEEMIRLISEDGMGDVAPENDVTVCGTVGTIGTAQSDAEQVGEEVRIVTILTFHSFSV
jgi:hypothetical protein